MAKDVSQTAEGKRLVEDESRAKNWKRWGTYLPERQWATVREDYSRGGDSWGSFDYETARSRVYRWGEDGLLGWCDRQCRLAVAPALWNGRDDHLKERLFGLTSPEGNHGEDVKELYYYLDATPTHSYGRARYRYPQAAFPYHELRQVNGSRGRGEPEYEITDSSVFSGNDFFDLDVIYAKKDSDTSLVRYVVSNHGEQTASVCLLAQIWFRNVWKWGRQGEDYGPKPLLEASDGQTLRIEHHQLGEMLFAWRTPSQELLFTDNETDVELLYGAPPETPWVKNAFHRHIVAGEADAVNPERHGTKAAVVYRLTLAPGETRQLDFLLAPAGGSAAPFADFDDCLEQRRREADAFYDALNPGLSVEDTDIWRQAYAGLLWSKQFYFYAVKPWLEGDPSQPAPPEPRYRGRNLSWSGNLYNRDVILMPDRWEYPWYAAWDLAFHAVPVAKVDPHLAKQQLILMLREWYMHPNGQLPAYEFNFSDVNPPVHAWACLTVYRATGGKDRAFLEKVFHKLLLNFTWWVNRTDADGDNVFSGGFLGLDNIGAFDRSHFPKSLGELKQSDATAWMGFFSLRMLQIAFELARDNRAYEGIASKFFEHFVAIVNSVNSDCGMGLWHAEDRFYYDFVVPSHGGPAIPMRVRSLVGLLPLIAVEILDKEQVNSKKRFRRRMDWFLKEAPSLGRHLQRSSDGSRMLLSLVPRSRLLSLLERMLDEKEFLSPYGIRSLSRSHEEQPFTVNYKNKSFQVRYEPGESQTTMFGGNSNWRGPIWYPVNYLLIDALKRYYAFYGDELKVELPTGSGNLVNLLEVARDLERRLVSLFRRDDDDRIPATAELSSRKPRELWNSGRLFHEYFHAETGQGLGSCHQTGWTALVASCLEDLQEPLHTSACQASL